MFRLHLLILLAFLGTAAWAQDAESEAVDETQAEEEAAPPADDVSDEEIEELLGLEEDYTEVEDDDFDPTQEVRFEQSINFPTDI